MKYIINDEQCQRSNVVKNDNLQALFHNFLRYVRLHQIILIMEN